jgi:hypothetical protein
MNGAERTVRILELRRVGWNEARIGLELGVSRQRVHELLERHGQTVRAGELATLRATLSVRVERYGLVSHRLADRLARVNRRCLRASEELEVVVEEMEALEIDRLLGLEFSRNPMQGPNASPLSTKSGNRPNRAQGPMQGGHPALVAETSA